MNRRSLAAGLALLLAGCTLGPDYRRPDLDVPEGYYRAMPAQATRSIADIAWWEIFNDPQLVGLIDEALRDNLDLAIAAAQVLEAQAQVAAVRSPLFPQLSGQGQVARTNQNAAFSNENSFLAALFLSWELDFWGRYRRATEAARASLLATEEGRRSVIASLVAFVAEEYLRLKGLRQRLDVVRQTAAAQRDTLRLVRLLAQQGVQSDAEVRQAESQLLTTENQIPGLEQQLAESEHALAILLGKPPRSFDVGVELPPIGVPPEVPAGLPSELIERRPDIRQAEQMLMAANADIGVARALFFPGISLTGTLGRVSETLGGLVSDRGQTLTAVDATILAPIFTGGSLTANHEIARARAGQAVLSYRRTVLIALQEVSNALVAYDRGRAETEGNRRRVEVASESLRLAQLRFRSGVVSFLEVLDAERQLLSAQLDLNATEVNQRVATVQLYRALGGGWNPAR